MTTEEIGGRGRSSPRGRERAWPSVPGTYAREPWRPTGDTLRSLTEQWKKCKFQVVEKDHSSSRLKSPLGKALEGRANVGIATDIISNV